MIICSAAGGGGGDNGNGKMAEKEIMYFFNVTNMKEADFKKNMPNHQFRSLLKIIIIEL